MRDEEKRKEKETEKIRRLGVGQRAEWSFYKFYVMVAGIVTRMLNFVQG